MESSKRDLVQVARDTVVADLKEMGLMGDDCGGLYRIDVPGWRMWRGLDSSNQALVSGLGVQRFELGIVFEVLS